MQIEDQGPEGAYVLSPLSWMSRHDFREAGNRKAGVRDK